MDDKVFGAAESTILCTEKLIRDPFFFTREKIFKSASQNFCVERSFSKFYGKVGIISWLLFRLI